MGDNEDLEHVDKILEANQLALTMGRFPQKYRDLFKKVANCEFDGDEGTTLRFLVILYENYHYEIELENARRIENGV